MANGMENWLHYANFKLLPGSWRALYKNMNYGSTGEFRNTTAWADLVCGVEEATPITQTYYSLLPLITEEVKTT